MKPRDVLIPTTGTVTLCLLLLGGSARGQGSLIPPGPPAPTMKTLDQIEPRTPIGSVPWTISQRGSYYLTSSLYATNGGITITASDVTLDLNGFTLRGGTNIAVGIFLSGSASNTVVLNGRIKGWAGSGIYGPNAAGCRVEGVEIAYSGESGIWLGSEARIIGCYLDHNVGHGAVGSANALLRGCLSISNSNSGFSLGDGGVIEDCQIVGNGGKGIIGMDNLVVRNCVVQGNSSDGISAGAKASFVNCTSFNNGGSGMGAVDNSVVRDCITQSNGSAGINLAANCWVERSLSQSNSIGILVGLAGSVKDCQAQCNRYYGIRANGGSQVKGCQASANADCGIYTAGNCSIVDCLATENNLSGIYVYDSNGRISGNTCISNNLAADSSQGGIFTRFSNHRIQDNHLINNGYAGIQVTAGGTNCVVIRNNVSGNGANNYLIPANNDLGPVGKAATATSPWANLSN